MVQFFEDPDLTTQSTILLKTTQSDTIPPPISPTADSGSQSHSPDGGPQPGVLAFTIACIPTTIPAFRRCLPVLELHLHSIFWFATTFLCIVCNNIYYELSEYTHITKYTETISGQINRGRRYVFVSRRTVGNTLWPSTVLMAINTDQT